MVDTLANDSALGSEVVLEISNVAHGGVFVARHEGRVIFTPDVLPGERIRARISDVTHKSFWRAEALEVLDASEHRVAHVWPEAALDRPASQRAGGAEFGHAALPYQRELKRAVLTDAFSRFAKTTIDLDVEPVGTDADGAGTGWRTRVSLHVGPDGSVGPYAARSHDVVTVAGLPLATPAIEAAAPLRSRLEPGSSVDLVHTGGRAEAQAIVTAAGAKPRSAGVVTERVGDRDFLVDQLGFWQVHTHAATALTDAVQWALDADRFDVTAANHDLYGGVGLLAAAMGDRFGSTTRMTTVESDARATDHAARNLVDWIGARAETDRVDRYLSRVLRESSREARSRWVGASVVLDPPRSGAGAAVVRGLAELGPAQIVYVACDPVALARDVATFAQHGYALDAVRAFDLFPHTHHVEAVARLVPAA